MLVLSIISQSEIFWRICLSTFWTVLAHRVFQVILVKTTSSFIDTVSIISNSFISFIVCVIFTWSRTSDRDHCGVVSNCNTKLYESKAWKCQLGQLLFMFMKYFYICSIICLCLPGYWLVVIITFDVMISSLEVNFRNNWSQGNSGCCWGWRRWIHGFNLNITLCWYRFSF